MNETIWENIPRYLFLFLIFLLPLLVLPYTVFPLEINKAFLFYAVTILATLAWLISILQKASFRIPKSAALLALAGIVVVWLASSFFSANTALSLVGSGQEINTVFAIVFFSAALFLIASLFQSKAKAMFFYLTLFGSALLVFIFQFFRVVFDITLYPWSIFASKVANTIGSWNEIGIFFGFIGLLSVVFLELSNFGKRLKAFMLVMLLISLIGVAFVNFTTVWIVMGIFLVVFLVYLFSTHFVSVTEEGSGQRKFVRFALIVLLMALFFIMAKTLVGDFVSSTGATSIEVRPAWSATWQVAKNALLKNNFLLGSGPNTFLYDWLKFKPADINLTIFWSYPFQAGIGLLPSWLASTGILGGLSWFVFLAFLFWYGLKVIAYSENGTMRALLIASFLGSLYLWIFTIVYTPGFVLFALAFLTTGIFIALLCESGRIKVIEVSFFNKPKLSFISSLIIVLLMISSVASLYLLSQKYWAAYSYGRGLAIFNTAEGNIDEVDNLISRAAKFDQQDRYFRALSEVGLVKIQKLMNQTDLSKEDAQTQFQNLLAYSIGNAQNAVQVNSLDYNNWMSLGQVYEAIIPFKITGSREAALNAYKEAAARAPFDPTPLYTSARVEIQANDLNSAKDFLISSINIKSDFTSSVFLLSQVEAQLGNLKEAITRTEQARYLAPNDVGVLFQLGLLYYQDKNFESGRLALERAVSLNPNYSNARYFLGLIYDKQEKNKEAIDQFTQIQNLNPDNQEIAKILENLNAGKPALQDISPPQPSPEERKEAPLDETKPKK